ncbi:nucleotide-binding alpha-beta plait domain-containing protein [Tanacetum coccineum]
MKKTLWSTFKEYGKVMDVYIAGIGTRFGFVRFHNVDSAADLEKRLREISFGARKMIINIAKFKKGNTFSKSAKRPDEQQKYNQHGCWHSRSFNQRFNGQSYKDVTTVRNSSLISQRVVHVDKESENSVCHGRPVRLKIEGLPVQVWRDDAAREVVKIFGEVLEAEILYLDSNLLNSTYVIILTKNMADINSIVLVIVKHKKYQVRVYEDRSHPVMADASLDHGLVDCEDPLPDLEVDDAISVEYELDHVS